MEMNPPQSPLVPDGVATNARHASIGEILIGAGRLDPRSAVQIANAQREHGTRFGEAGVRLKLLKPADVAFALARQFSYPYLSSEGTALSPSLVCAFEPFGRIAEQLRSIRTRLVLQQTRAGVVHSHSIAVASPGRGEGRSFMAANLAVVFAQSGERVLLVDADMRAPSQHRLFGIANHAGLSNVLLGRASLECAVRIREFDGLSMLAAGSQPPNPQELLSRPSWPELLRQASVRYDRVIVDTPGAEPFADAYLVAAHCSTTLLVARANATSAKALSRVQASLRATAANVSGAILNEV
jgi:protein-tyrosine kinase